LKKDYLQAIINEAEKRLAQIEIELIEFEYRKENGDQIIRIYIDKDSGVNLETCAAATRAIKDLIDNKEINYDHMEVSSPGLDRIIKKDKDFKRYNGYAVNIKMLNEYDGPRKIAGILVDYNHDNISLKTEHENIIIPCDLISSVRLKPDI